MALIDAKGLFRFNQDKNHFSKKKLANMHAHIHPGIRFIQTSRNTFSWQENLRILSIPHKNKNLNCTIHVIW